MKMGNIGLFQYVPCGVPSLTHISIKMTRDIRMSSTTQRITPNKITHANISSKSTFFRDEG